MKILKALSFGEGWERPSCVDEYKPAGRYEIDYNVAHESLRAMASGVYFYQLKSDNPSSSSGQSFIQTKKMIYLK